MTATGETIPAMTASDVAFADDEIAFGKPFDVIAHALDHPDELVPDGHGDRDCLLGPGIPVIYMYIRPADGGLQDADQDIIALDLGHWDFLQPKSRLGFGLYHRLHHFLHGAKLSAHFAHVDLARCTVLRDDERSCQRRLSELRRKPRGRVPFSFCVSSARSGSGRSRSGSHFPATKSCFGF